MALRSNGWCRSLACPRRIFPNENIDSGGSLLLSGGAATFGSGGHISLTSGFGKKKTGDVTIETSESHSSSGASGRIHLSTGIAVDNSGNITLHSGDSLTGDAGPIEISVGRSLNGAGSNLTLSSGSTNQPNSSGGDININGGT